MSGVRLLRLPELKQLIYGSPTLDVQCYAKACVKGEAYGITFFWYFLLLLEASGFERALFWCMQYPWRHQDGWPRFVDTPVPVAWHATCCDLHQTMHIEYIR